MTRFFTEIWCKDGCCDRDKPSCINLLLFLLCRAVTFLAICWLCLVATDSWHDIRTARGMLMSYLSFHAKYSTIDMVEAFASLTVCKTNPLPQRSALNSYKIPGENIDGERRRP